MPPFASPLYHEACELPLNIHFDQATSSSRLDHKQPPAQPISPKASRTVSFSASVRVRPTLHLNDYSDDEVEQCWYASYEFKAMKHQVKVGAKFMDKGILVVQGEDFPTRGLEIFTKKQSQQRVRDRRASSDAVFNEQSLQQTQGIVDSEAIARVYRSVSVACLVRAQNVAAKDRLDIQ